jgi:hypothetical protein
MEGAMRDPAYYRLQAAKFVNQSQNAKSEKHRTLLLAKQRRWCVWLMKPSSCSMSLKVKTLQRFVSPGGQVDNYDCVVVSLNLPETPRRRASASQVAVVIE